MPTFSEVKLVPLVIARTLAALASLLIFLSVAGQLTKYLTEYGNVYGLVRFVDLDEERNLPTLFSALLLLFSALLLAIISFLKMKGKSPYASIWTVLCLGFLLMTADELLLFHERFTDPIRKLLGGTNLGIFYYAWVIPGIAGVAILGLFFLRFLLHLSAKARYTFLFAATLYIGGAIGFELIGGRYAEMYDNDNLTYNMIATVEESLEMFGIIVYIYGLLTYIADNYNEVRFRFDDAKGS